MAKIPLRAYIKEIEGLIERGEVDQAVAHAKNVLQSYPKHIETYRVLGKAFLESQRFSQAEDILERVLSVIPDDFVSQIGMSIIKEDEGNLDQAIWHMERAYEVQPFNPAVQDELRRLYGRRDGIQPPKIRLTRGALIRMYAKGDLYPQAIAETRIALAEEPNRLDLEVILARLLHASQQKAETVDHCFRLLGKLPFCQDALSILANVLPGTNRASDVPALQGRLVAMDPYLAFVSANAETSANVPEQAVMVEHFLWDSSMVDAQAPEWTRTVGVQWEEPQAEESVPDWFNSLQPTDVDLGTAPTTEHEQIVSDGQELQAFETSDEMIPDFLKDAGWIKSDRSADEIMAEQGAIFDEEAEDEIAPAEIPDWLQSIAPSGESEPGAEGEAGSDWVSGLFGQPEAESGNTMAADMPALPDFSDRQGETPDWMSGLETGSRVSSEFEPPDWLSETAQEETSSGLPFASETEGAGLNGWDQQTQVSQGEAETPDWLKSFENETSPTSQGGELPDWMQSIPGEAAEPEQLASDQEQQWPVLEQPAEAEFATGENIPDWLKSLDPESLADMGAGGTTLLDQSQIHEEYTPAAEPEVESPLASDETVSSVMPDISDMDATMAWLEGLAAKQGADEATLITPPDQRTDTPPEWLQSQVGEELPAETEAIDALRGIESGNEVLAESDLAEEAELPDWLAEVASAPTQPLHAVTEEQTAQREVEEVQEYGTEIEPVLPVDILARGETPATGNEGVEPDLSDMDATMAWLESLAAKQGADEATLITPPEMRTEEPPEWIKKQTDELPPIEALQTKEPEQVVEAREQPQAALEEEFTELEEGEAQMEAPAAFGVEAESEEIDLETGLQEPAMAVETTSESMPDMTDMDATMAWLEALAAKQGADEATLITPQDQRTEEPPEWVRKQTGDLVSPEVAEQSAEAEPISEGELPDWLVAAAVEQLSDEPDVEITEDDIVQAVVEPGKIEQEAEPETEMPSLSDMDATMAWLEALAAKQGADEATLITPQEMRTEEPPEWVRKQTGELKPIEGTTAEETTPTTEVEPVVAWTQEVEPVLPVDELGFEDIGSVEEAEVVAEAAEAPASGQVTDWLSQLEEESETEAFGYDMEAAAPVDGISAAWAPEEEVAQPEVETPAAPAFQVSGTSLADLQSALRRGDLDTAIQGYASFIHSDMHLDEIIHDVREALYRYPVDIMLWQTLGDAYVKKDKLQEALDAYTKAEELLR